MKNVIALGFFDGVHLGHAAILRGAVSLARELLMTPTALTYERPPRAVTRGGAPLLLTDPEQRSALMRACGVAHVFVLPFTPEFAALSPAQFVEEILVREFNCGGVVCGEDFRFGKGALGDTAALGLLCAAQGIALSICPPVLRGTRAVSSTAVRAAVAEGDLQEAAAMLGRPYTLRLYREDDGLYRAPREMAVPPDGDYLAAADGGAARAVYFCRAGCALPECGETCSLTFLERRMHTTGR
ncbi:MAG: FAD synthetase family protein [Clostridia bacterium]|nr:FAD synthetase family protein [Clostridia bacterium]